MTSIPAMQYLQGLGVIRSSDVTIENNAVPGEPGFGTPSAQYQSYLGRCAGVNDRRGL